MRTQIKTHIMKRIILFAVFLFQICISCAEHIKFMDMEVSGDAGKFKTSLIKKGFKYIKSFESSYEFMGKFANEYVRLTVLASPETKKVCKVIVYFSEKKTWVDLRNDYFEKKNLYKEKYPLDAEFEFFSSPYEEGDSYEMRAVKTDNCRYKSFFLALGGYITVEIEKTSNIKVIYEDRENTKIAQKELKQSALDDI